MTEIDLSGGQRCNCVDSICYGYFRYLLPSMIYEGTEEENKSFFNALVDDKEELIFSLFNEMCAEDKIACPYSKEDFKVNIFERGNINFLQIAIPLQNPGGSGLLRAYMLYSEHDDEYSNIRYFAIIRFENGQIYNTYIDSEQKGILGEELTGHPDEMEYEYWRIVNDYARVCF